MGRPRNTIAGYPLEERMAVAQRLIDGATYAEIREWCVARGLKSPHNASFLAYSGGAEFRKIKDELLTWKRRAEEKRAIAAAIQAGGGPDALADLAMFEAVDALRELISGGDLTSGKDVATVATAISNLKRTLLKDAEARHLQELAEQAERTKAEADRKADEVGRQAGISPATMARIKRLYGIPARDEEVKAADPAAVADALDRVLGVKKTMPPKRRKAMPAPHTEKRNQP